jgi:hypothetical protein
MTNDEYPKNISNSEYKIKFNHDKSVYLLLRNGEPLHTPGGNIVEHKSERLLAQMQSELESEDQLDPSVLSTYSVYCTFKDSFEKEDKTFSVEEVREFLITDSILRCCAGPERLYQYDKWKQLFELLTEYNLDYPDIVQTMDTEEIEAWIKSRGPKYVKSIDTFVQAIHEEINRLNPAQKAVIINSIVVHETLIYGYLLATKRCTEIEYATAILAGQCLLPQIFTDVSRSEYKQELNKLIRDAQILTGFIRFSLTPDSKVTNIIKTKIPNWAFLPQAARWAITEALNRIYDAQSSDYSPYIVLLGKGLEITLKELVFETFRKQTGIVIESEIEANLIIRENHKEIENFAKFIYKKPHFLELGGMRVTLEKHGNNTAKKNPLLAQFFEFVSKNFSTNGILSKSFLMDCKSITELRNRAAHHDRFLIKDAHVACDLLFKALAAL